jgi:hypothetical protein
VDWVGKISGVRLNGSLGEQQNYSNENICLKSQALTLKTYQKK